MGVQEQEQLWGGETSKAVANFPVSGEPIPVPVARWLGRIKAAAARVNAELGLLDADKAARIAAAGRPDRRRRVRRPVPDRRVPDRLGHLVEHERQRGDRDVAGDGRPPERRRQHGPVVQRRVPVGRPPRGALELVATNDLLPVLEQLAQASLADKADEFDDVVKSGRTHWMDAVPVTLGQEFGGYAAQVRDGSARSRDALRAARRRFRSAAPRSVPASTPTRSSRPARAGAADRRDRARDPRRRGSLRGAGQPRRARRALGRAQGASPCR